MAPQTFGDLLDILLCLSPFFLGTLGLLVLGILLIWLIYRQRQPKGAATLAHERRVMRARLEDMRANLRPWSDAGLTDLSTDWNAHWSRLGRDLSAYGTILSTSEPKGPPWVAFALKIRGARALDGQLLACTTAQTWEYRITPEGVSVQVDGSPWGRVLPDGTLLDAAGQPIGSAPRPGGLPAMLRMSNLAYLHDRREREYPVTLGGRLVGHLANPAARMLNIIPLKKREFPPAVTLKGAVTYEERNWLLALAILQVAGYNLLETVWTNR